MIYENIEKGDKENNKYINNQKIVEKPWGREIWLELNDKYCYKRIEIRAGFKTSYQIHNVKLETNFIIKGKTEVWLENDNGIVEQFYMNEGDFFTVLPKRKHRVIAITDIILQEVSTPEVDDVIRINDEFNRTNGRILEEHFKPIVCIIAAGIGSRLGNISKKCHKTLLPYKHKAILSHIIEKFKDDIEIVIAVGYLKEQIYEYIKIYHFDKNIKFIEVDNYEGIGSGTAYSLECCRSVLQKPFYFCVSDFYTDTFLQNETFCNDNWIGVCETNTPETYSTIEIQNEQICSFKNKSHNGYSHAFTGVFYMYDYSLFWELFDKNIDDKKELVDIFKNIQSFKFKIKKINWNDIGTDKLYNNFIEKNEDSYLYLHNTKQEYKYKKNNLFIKQMDSPDKIMNIVKRSHFLSKNIPKIINIGNYYLSYEYVEGNTLYYINDKSKYLDFLYWFEKNICNNEIINNRLYYSQNAFEFYKIKTDKRLNMIKQMHNFKILDNVNKINGKKILHIDDYINMINWDDLSNIIQTPLFHGDLQFDNIVLMPNNEYKFIDWREDFGGITDYGDLYYDLAKLYGGMELNYLQMKNPVNYNISIKNNECIITGYYDTVLKNIQENEFIDFLNRNNFNKMRIKLLTAIIFLNMAPLHMNDFDIFLFFKSKQLLEEIFS